MTKKYKKESSWVLVASVPLPPCRRQGGEEIFLLLILDLGTRWVEWSASRPGRSLPSGKDPRYPLYRRLGGPQSCSGHRGLRRNLCLCRGSNSGRPVVQSVVTHYTDWTTPAPVLGGSHSNVRIQHRSSCKSWLLAFLSTDTWFTS
jgi:hypothetical protein